MTTVDEVMRRDVAVVHAQDPIDKAWRSMIDQGVSAIPVVGVDGRLIGLLTDDDLIVRRIPRRARWWQRVFGEMGRLADDYRKTVGTTVGDVMEPAPVEIAPDATVETVAALMHARRIRVMPVVAGGILVGVVTPAEVIADLAGSPMPDGPPASDPEIVREMQWRMEQQPWTARHRVYVEAERGVVQLYGLVESRAERWALVAMARAVPGVAGVEDHLLIRDEVVRRRMSPR